MLINMSTHFRLYLNPQQRQHLENLIRSGNAPARVQTRARILLLTDRNHEARLADQAIARALMCSTGTVHNVRKRFCAAAAVQGTAQTPESQELSTLLAVEAAL